MASLAGNFEVMNIFDFMCGTIKDVLAKLGEKVARDELFYLSLLERIECNPINFQQNKQSKTNLKKELKQQKAQAQCITDLEIAEKISERKRILSANFDNAVVLVATSKLLVCLVEIVKTDCLIIDDYSNNRQVLLFEKKMVKASEKYLFDYIIKSTPFSASNNHIMCVVQGGGAIEKLCETSFVKVEKVGMAWLMAVRKYVEDMNFVRNKFAPMMKNILKSNCVMGKQKGRMKKEGNFSAINYNQFDGLYNYFRGINDFSKE